MKCESLRAKNGYFSSLKDFVVFYRGLLSNNFESQNGTISEIKCNLRSWVALWKLSYIAMKKLGPRSWYNPAFLSVAQMIENLQKSSYDQILGPLQHKYPILLHFLWGFLQKFSFRSNTNFWNTTPHLLTSTIWFHSDYVIKCES